MRNIQRVSNHTIEDMASTLDMDFYHQCYKEAFTSFEPTKQQYIGTYCVMIPDELIYALGYTPLRLCAGHQIPALLGDEMVPRDACPVVKAFAERENVPLLRVETDFSTEDVEQIKIRFEAFVEMIDQRRKTKHG